MAQKIVADEAAYPGWSPWPAARREYARIVDVTLIVIEHLAAIMPDRGNESPFLQFPAIIRRNDGTDDGEPRHEQEQRSQRELKPPPF
jgi:hypothetical protein